IGIRFLVEADVRVAGLHEQRLSGALAAQIRGEAGGAENSPGKDKQGAARTMRHAAQRITAGIGGLVSGLGHAILLKGCVPIQTSAPVSLFPAQGPGHERFFGGNKIDPDGVLSSITMTSRRAQFEARVLIHLDAGLRLARALMGSANAAEDRLQDAVVRAFRGFEGLRGEQAGPWFLAIVRNTCLTALVRDRRHEHMPLPEDEDGSDWLADPAAGPEELV